MNKKQMRQEALSIKNELECHRGWDSALAYFSHSSGKVSLGEAIKVWEKTMALAKMVIELTEQTTES